MPPRVFHFLQTSLLLNTTNHTYKAPICISSLPILYVKNLIKFSSLVICFLSFIDLVYGRCTNNIINSEHLSIKHSYLNLRVVSVFIKPYFSMISIFFLRHMRPDSVERHRVYDPIFLCKVRRQMCHVGAEKIHSHVLSHIKKDATK